MKKIIILIPLFLLAFTSKYTPRLNNSKTNNYVAFLATNTYTRMSKAKLKQYKITLKEIKNKCRY